MEFSYDDEPKLLIITQNINALKKIKTLNQLIF